MINWIASYLSSRNQVVRVSSVLSEPLLVTSGVPRGSILGPLLFLLYVNDLPSVVPGVSLFADDTGLICSEKSVDRLACSMQFGINAIIAWMTAWQLRPNVDKAEAMFITNSPPSRVLCFPLSTTSIRIVSKHKHLGVVFDSTLCWSSHVEYVCKRTSSALGMVQPHYKHLSSTCKYLFYRFYILPIFDYCDTAWCSALSASSLNMLCIIAYCLRSYTTKIAFSPPSLCIMLLVLRPLFLAISLISALLFIKSISRSFPPTCKPIIGSFLQGVPAIT